MKHVDHDRELAKRLFGEADAWEEIHRIRELLRLIDCPRKVAIDRHQAPQRQINQSKWEN